MLSELRISNLGVIEELQLVLPAGSIAITGETGAGKTMIVGAIQLLMGGRADPEMVRIGADEAAVEARFVTSDGAEIVARRVVPATGRSRAYLDGGLATAGALADRLGPLIDLHGQHSQQSLLKPPTQRRSLDRFGGIDAEPVRHGRADVAAIDAALVAQSIVGVHAAPDLVGPLRSKRPHGVGVTVEVNHLLVCRCHAVIGIGHAPNQVAVGVEVVGLGAHRLGPGH